MHRAAADDEQVPDPVRMAQALVEHVEHDADRIDHAARGQPGETGRPQRSLERDQRRQRGPAQEDLDRQRQAAIAIPGPHLLPYRDDRQ